MERKIDAKKSYKKDSKKVEAFTDQFPFLPTFIFKYFESSFFIAEKTTQNLFCVFSFYYFYDYKFLI